jgi:hypothetical protein
LSRVGCVIYRTGLGLDDWIYCTLYIHTIRDYGQYSAIASLHTLQFTVTHARTRVLSLPYSYPGNGFITVCHFNSHMKSSWHSLIPFLPFLLNHLRLPSPELDPILFLLDHFTSRLLFSAPSTSLLLLLLSCRTLPIITLNGPHRKHLLVLFKDACLQLRYLAMDVLLLSREYVYRPVA